MGPKNYRHNSFTLKGFTLVELLIAFSVIAILAVLLVAYFRSQIMKGNDARRRSDINRIKVAVEEYEKDHDCYPLLSEMQSCGTDPAIAIHPYLNDVPCDPSTKQPYVYEASCSTDDCCPVWYRIYADMEYTQDPNLTPGIGPGAAFNYVAGSDNAPVNVSGTSPTATPVGNGLDPDGVQFYGCRSGACVPINWDPAIPGPECTVSWRTADCNFSCGNPGLECVRPQ
jgi:prepilin-type N-terminal cleavage/methylation domain-containing protein